MSAHHDFILGVDLDGVCGDYSKAFRKVVAEHMGVQPSELAVQESWDFDEWGINSREEFKALHRKAVVEARVFRNMEAIDGVSEALWRLSDQGVWIRIITHRLLIKGQHGIAAGDTVDWLEAKDIPYRDLCFLGDKPEVEANLYIDDAPHNVVGLREAGNDVIVFNQPYNQAVAGPRAYSWGDIETIITRMLAGKTLEEAAK